MDEQSILDIYAGFLGARIKCHDKSMDYVYDARVVLVTPHVIVVLLDDATIPTMFEQGSLIEVVYDSASDTLNEVEGGLTLLEVPPAAILQ